MTTLLTSSLLALSLATSAYSTPLSTSPHHVPQRSPFAQAPLLEENHIHGTLNNSYIVMLKDGLPPTRVSNHLNFLQSKHEEDPLVGENSGLRHVYTHVSAYSGHFTEQVVEQLRSLPEVDYIERDQVVRISDEDVSSSSIELQKNAPWGLARLSHRSPLRLGTFTQYLYDNDGGEGVDAYVIDTGVYVSHPEFQGRAFWGQTIPQNDVDEDANGHGTHCAGTIASKSYGVAKKASVIAVKVLGSNGSGTMSDVIAGVDWAAQSAKAKAEAAQKEVAATGSTKHKGSVANMSLGGGKSPALDKIVNSATDSGLHFAVAAGNENRDACNSSPAAAEKPLTVGASTLMDERAYFSNHGPCVDVFAPGLNIKSTWNNGQTNTISGTSMASPHVCGLLAYLLSIYPSVTFNPQLAEAFEVPELGVKAQSPFTTMYSVAHAALPRFITSFLPSPRLIEAVTAPIPSPKPITPAQLKKAVLALATPGMLSDLPKDTVNLLIFNNATVA